MNATPESVGDGGEVEALYGELLNCAAAIAENQKRIGAILLRAEALGVDTRPWRMDLQHRGGHSAAEVECWVRWARGDFDGDESARTLLTHVRACELAAMTAATVRDLTTKPITLASARSGRVITKMLDEHHPEDTRAAITRAGVLPVDATEKEEPAFRATAARDVTERRGRPVLVCRIAGQTMYVTLGDEIIDKLVEMVHPQEA